MQHKDIPKNDKRSSLFLPQAKQHKVCEVLMREVVQRALLRTLIKVAERISGSLATEVKTSYISLGEIKMFCLAALAERETSALSGKKMTLYRRS